MVRYINNSVLVKNYEAIIGPAAANAKDVRRHTRNRCNIFYRSGEHRFATARICEHTTVAICDAALMALVSSELIISYGCV